MSMFGKSNGPRRGLARPAPARKGPLGASDDRVEAVDVAAAMETPVEPGAALRPPELEPDTLEPSEPEPGAGIDTLFEVEIATDETPLVQAPAPPPPAPPPPPNVINPRTAASGEPDRGPTVSSEPPAPAPAASAPPPPPSPPPGRVPPSPPERKPASVRSSSFYEIKGDVFAALMDAMDMTRIATLEPDEAEAEIIEIASDIVSIKNYVISTSEQDALVKEICDDVLGYGPLETLLERDDIADIMVNGAGQVFIETGGKIQMTDIRFRDNQQLLEICQRMVSKVGRRVDEASPICDARLLDGSRVNVIAPPLAIDGAALTIRKFKRDKLKMTDLVKFGSISPDAARLLEIAGGARCNIVISGGTGSGKTTLLNCLSGYAANDERIITCEDSAELQLQQPHVVRLETRPPNIEGKGEITMRQLVKNCLRMRPERIIVGEVRGAEAFDLLQAMNTGHDGSMGTLHANSPRECLSRLESMITMGGFSLPSRTIREMICSAVEMIVQAQRLRDGSRRITHVTEVLGMEGDTIITQDLVRYRIDGEGPDGKLIGRHVGCGVGQPKFYERARTYGRGEELTAILAEMDAQENG